MNNPKKLIQFNYKGLEYRIRQIDLIQLAGSNLDYCKVNGEVVRLSLTARNTEDGIPIYQPVEKRTAIKKVVADKMIEATQYCNPDEDTVELNLKDYVEPTILSQYPQEYLIHLGPTANGMINFIYEGNGYIYTIHPEQLVDGSICIVMHGAAHRIPVTVDLNNYTASKLAALWDVGGTIPVGQIIHIPPYSPPEKETKMVEKTYPFNPKIDVEKAAHTLNKVMDKLKEESDTIDTSDVEDNSYDIYRIDTEDGLTYMVFNADSMEEAMLMVRDHDESKGELSYPICNAELLTAGGEVILVKPFSNDLSKHLVEQLKKQAFYEVIKSKAIEDFSSVDFITAYLDEVFTIHRTLLAQMYFYLQSKDEPIQDPLYHWREFRQRITDSTPALDNFLDLFEKYGESMSPNEKQEE